MERIKYLFGEEFLLTPVTNSRLQTFYLGFSIFLICTPIILKIFFSKDSKRSAVLGKFDRYWFFGYLALGLFGLLVWFSRSQNLPIFSTRVVSYLFLSITFIYGVVLAFIYQKTVPQKVKDYYEKERKKRYLK